MGLNAPLADLLLGLVRIRVKHFNAYRGISTSMPTAASASGIKRKAQVQVHDEASVLMMAQAVVGFERVSYVLAPGAWAHQTS